jgi:hypothetical protein
VEIAIHLVPDILHGVHPHVPEHTAGGFTAARPQER